MNSSYSEIFENPLKNRKNLFLLDNCDDFMKVSPRTFYMEIQKLIREFPKSKVIMTLKKNSFPNYDQKELHCCPFELLPLDSK